MITIGLLIAVLLVGSVCVVRSRKKEKRLINGHEWHKHTAIKHDPDIVAATKKLIEDGDKLAEERERKLADYLFTPSKVWEVEKPPEVNPLTPQELQQIELQNGLAQQQLGLLGGIGQACTGIGHGLGFGLQQTASEVEARQGAARIAAKHETERRKQLRDLTTPAFDKVMLDDWGSGL